MGENLYRSELDSIRKIIATVARRLGFLHEAAEDFESYVHEKLIRDDYALLRKFEERSSLKTFLTVVVTRLGLDYRNHRWGKWRPSEAARRAGEMAVALERLTHRDGFTLAEAGEALRTNLGFDVTDAEIDELVGSLPARLPRVFVGEESLQPLPGAARADAELVEKERNQELETVQHLLKAILAGLDLEDRLMIRMHFDQGLTWTQISEALNVPRKLIYRRKEALFRSLRLEFESRGVSHQQVASLLQSDP